MTDNKKGLDKKIIENNKIINIYKTLNGINGNFNYLINTVPFIPDSVIVKCVVYNYGAGAENTTSLIYSNIVDDYITSFFNGIFLCQQTEFILQKHINGQYNFKIFNFDGTIKTDRQGDLFIQLEFVKYKNVKQDVIY